MNREEAILKLKVMQIDSECWMYQEYHTEAWLILKQKHAEAVKYIEENLK